MRAAPAALAFFVAGAAVVACGHASPGAIPPSAPLPVAPADAPAPSVAPEVTDVADVASSAPSAHETGACADDMVAVASFCIDRYEAPNVRGELPFALRTAHDGEAWCAARGKRLCEEDEWVRACQGAHHRRFPYGDVHREAACNDDRPWNTVSWKALAQWPDVSAVVEATRLFGADMSGARAACVSEDGVYDLTGNVAEWVRRSGPSPRPGYDHVLKGCYWAGCFKEPEPDCAFTNGVHPSTFRTYEAGFRCCVDRVDRAEPPARRGR